MLLQDAAKKLDFVETVRLTLGGGELILDNDRWGHETFFADCVRELPWGLHRLVQSGVHTIP